MERATGFEPATASLEGWNSTTELRPPSFTRAECPGLRTERRDKISHPIQYSDLSTQSSALLGSGGQARIRTLEADGNRFTVCPLWPLGYLPETPAHDTTNLAGCRKSPPAAFSLRSEAQRTEAYAFASSLTAALLDGLFEHPARCSPVVLDVRTIEFPPCHNSFSAACYTLDYDCLLHLHDEKR